MKTKVKESGDIELITSPSFTDLDSRLRAAPSPQQRPALPGIGLRPAFNQASEGHIETSKSPLQVNIGNCHGYHPLPC